MRIISHRGLWKSPDQKNTEQAFINSLAEGFGIETDFRDMQKKIVVSHDMPNGSEMPIDQFLSLRDIQCHTLALNIKSDGLSRLLRQKLEQYDIQNCFVFDMSIPDMLAHIKAGNNVFTRLSDVEPQPLLLNESKGVWLDAFYSEWYNCEVINRLIDRGKQVCVVSPELHGREHRKFWEQIYEFSSNDDVMLCTDFPLEARIFFN